MRAFCGIKLSAIRKPAFASLVPRNVRLAEAPSHGVPAVLLDATSKGAQAYLGLADEILAQGAA